MKIVLAIILSCSIIFNYFNLNKIEAKQNDLVQIIQVADKNRIEIQSWKVYTRENIGEVSTRAEMEAGFEKLMKEKSSYEWDKEKEQVDHHYVATGTKVDEESGIAEKVVVTAYYTRGVYELMLSKEISSDNWNHNHLPFIEGYVGSGKQEVFYMINGKVAKDSLNLVEQSKQFLKDFEGAEVEGLYESNFVSVSAFTDKFDTTIKTSDNKPMNLHIGLRTTETNDFIDVTIGTPIITMEY